MTASSSWDWRPRSSQPVGCEGIQAIQEMLTQCTQTLHLAEARKLWYSTYWSMRNTGREESWLSAEVKDLHFCWPCRIRPYVGNALQPSSSTSCRTEDREDCRNVSV